MINKDVNVNSDVRANLAVRDNVDQIEFNLFRKFLEDACGISLGDNKQYLVTNRMRHLMADHKMASLGDLVRSLRQGLHRKLKEQVIDAMTTNETFWFRDMYPYEHLKNSLLPQLMGGNNKALGPLRIWSAACSSGQEPYSISMAIEEFKQKNMGTLPRYVHIVATDLSTTILEQARQGEYDELSVMRGLSSERLDKFFEKDDTTWRVKPFLRDRIDFRPINLMGSYAGLGKFDIVFCRNVLIYFNADLKRQILQKIHGSLNPQGMLYLGSSEGLAGVADLFEMVRCEPGILYKAI